MTDKQSTAQDDSTAEATIQFEMTESTFIDLIIHIALCDMPRVVYRPGCEVEMAAEALQEVRASSTKVLSILKRAAPNQVRRISEISASVWVGMKR